MADPASTYRVYRDTSLTGTFTTLVYEGTSTSFIDTGLAAERTYYYKVQGGNTIGWSALSTAVGYTTVSLTKATSFQVYRDTSATGTFTNLVFNAYGTSFTDTDVLPGTTYYYKIRSVNDAGVSAFSSVVTGTTTAVATAATSSLVTTSSEIDAQIASEKTGTDGSPSWDFELASQGDGTYIVPYITGTNKDLQQATVAAFTQLGTVPQLPDVGVDWLGFLLGTVTFGELTSQITAAIKTADITGYGVSFSGSGETLTATVGQRSTT